MSFAAVGICDTSGELISDFNGGSIAISAVEILEENLWLAVMTTSYEGQIWRSDGTAAGTKLVAQVMDGDSWEYFAYSRAMQGKVYFFVSDFSKSVLQLWKSEGAEFTTSMLGQFEGGPDPVFFGCAGDFLCFTTGELWRTDGTVAGTIRLGNVQVLDFQPGLKAGASLYFRGKAGDGLSSAQLWRTDGMESGTFAVTALNSGGNDGVLGTPVQAGGLMYFAGNDGAAGAELYRSDGTRDGTALVKDIASGDAGSSPTLLTPFGDRLVFFADDGIHGGEPWISDGTEAGTRLVADIADGAAGSIVLPARVNMLAANGMVYFTADDGMHGKQLWKTDGTSAGTAAITAFASGTTLSIVPEAEVNQAVYFGRYTQNDSYWYEFFVQRGSGYAQLATLSAEGQSPAMQWLSSIGGTVYFGSNDQLGRIDDNSAVLMRLQDANAGVSANPDSWPLPVVFKNRVFAQAGTGDLWAFETAGGEGEGECEGEGESEGEGEGEGESCCFGGAANKADVLLTGLLAALLLRRGR